MTFAAPADSPPGGGVRQLLANGLALLLAYVLPRIFTVASVVVAARFLGPTDFGAYGTAVAWAVVLSILATLGMQPLLVREMARAPQRAGALLRAAHLVKAGTNAVMLLTLLVLCRWVLDLDVRVQHAALALGVGYALAAWAENLGAWYQAAERMQVWARASALFGFVSGTVGVALLLATGSLVAFCWGPAVGWSAALLYLVRRAPPASQASRGPSALHDETMADARFLLGGLAPFAAAFIGVAIYSKVDVLLMSRWRSELDVGVYVAAYKFVDIFQALVIVAAAAVYPRLSRTAASRSWAGARSTEIILLAAVPAGLALHLVAGPATALLFGSDYAVSAGTVRILGLVLPLLAISIHGAYVLGAAGNMRPVAALYAVGIAVNILLNRSLIPAMGPQGAALARLASEAVMAIGFVGVLHVVARSAPGPRTLALAACAGALGWLAGLFPDPTGGWLRVAGAAGAWLALYVGGGALGRTEVRALTSALREGRSSGSRAGRTLDHAGQGAP